ncbi:alpha/beta hydrolase [Ekhidna lutea]|nr:alpha/beta hydrolase [Ekhidna lutea]
MHLNLIISNKLFRFITFLFLAYTAYGCGEEANLTNTSIDPPSIDSLITDSLALSSFRKESPFDLGDVQAKFYQEIPYDSKVRTQFDIWIPESDVPTGLVLYTHGGGFTSGNKGTVYSPKKNGLWDWPKDIRYLLKNKIAFATIRYSLLDSVETEGIKKSINDVQRALQFIRHHDELLNLAKNRVVLIGNSAGASISLLIALNDESANENSDDQILRESTRVQGVVVRETQASFNIEDRWTFDVFGDYDISFDEIFNLIRFRFLKFYGVSDMEEYETVEIDEYRKSVDMLELLTHDDPPLWVNNTLESLNHPLTSGLSLYHHPFHARALKEKADEVGVENVCYYGKNPAIFSDPSNESWTDFCIRMISE